MPKLKELFQNAGKLLRKTGELSLTGTASIFYGIGFAAHKIYRVPFWVWAAIRLGWGDAR